MAKALIRVGFTERMAYVSTADRLRSELEEIEILLTRLVRISPVRWIDHDAGMFRIANAPDYAFVRSTTEQLRLQVPLKEKYDAWFVRFQLLFPTPPSELEASIKEAHDVVANWIDLGRNYEITMNPEANVQAAQKVLIGFQSFLDLLPTSPEVVLIPDTNALTTSPNPESYKSIAGTTTFTFLLLPTVLSELDNLKNFARDPAYREKVAKVIRRMKGWRKQGSLIQGIVIHKTICVRAIAHEPNVRKTLPWLDPNTPDDRIIASVVEFQMTSPAACITLVTSDINLQNKAEAAKLPYAETP